MVTARAILEEIYYAHLEELRGLMFTLQAKL